MIKFVWIIITVILVLPSNALAQTNFADWLVGTTDDKKGTYAATINDSGSVLAENCNVKTGLCSWYIVTDVVCKQGDDYPALANTDVASNYVVLTCEGNTDKTKYRYVFKDWKTLEGLCKDSLNLGLAFAMANGRFNVYRFSLKGMTSSTASAEAAASRTKKERDATGTGTVVL